MAEERFKASVIKARESACFPRPSWLHSKPLHQHIDSTVSCILMGPRRWALEHVCTSVHVRRLCGSGLPLWCQCCFPAGLCGPWYGDGPKDGNDSKLKKQRDWHHIGYFISSSNLKAGNKYSGSLLVADIKAKLGICDVIEQKVQCIMQWGDLGSAVCEDKENYCTAR